MRTVYLCGPINGKTDDECKGWRATATSLLSGHFRIMDPMVRDYRGIEDSNVSAIVEQDLADIGESHFVLVNAETPSWGTAMEVLAAYRDLKTVVLFTSSPRISPWLRYHSHRVCHTVEGACGWLMEVIGENNFKKEIR